MELISILTPKDQTSIQYDTLEMHTCISSSNLTIATFKHTFMSKRIYPILFLPCKLTDLRNTYFHIRSYLKGFCGERNLLVLNYLHPKWNPCWTRLKDNRLCWGAYAWHILRTVISTKFRIILSTAAQFANTNYTIAEVFGWLLKVWWATQQSD